MEYSKEQIRKLFDEDAAAVAAELRIEVPKAVFRYAPHECCKCKKPLLVYTWPGHELFTTEEPPVGKPATIQWVSTRMSERSYWGNTCPHCNAVQGDVYVLAEPDSPLFGLGGPVENDSAEGFKDDLEKISEYYVTYLRGER